MNGIKLENIHLYATAWIMYMLLAMVLMIQQLVVAKGVFYIGWLLGSALAFVWIKDVYSNATSPIQRSSCILGAFGVGMFLFTYAMVPMYHLVCHATGHGGAAGGGGVELNLLARAYKDIPLGVSVSQKQVNLAVGDEAMFYVDVVNLSDHEVDAKMSLVMQPRSWQPYFNIVMPEDLVLEPKQHMRFPLAVQYTGAGSDMLAQASMMLLLQDTKSTGSLGKTNDWRKMTKGIGGKHV